MTTTGTTTLIAISVLLARRGDDCCALDVVVLGIVVLGAVVLAVLLTGRSEACQLIWMSGA